MSENPVNPVIHGPLWTTKTKTALNDCKIKVEAREKTGDQCTLYKVYISMQTFAGLAHASEENHNSMFQGINVLPSF